MAIPFKIGIASEGKAFRLGIENDVIEPLEDAGKELKDLARSGDNAGDDLEDALKGAQRESDRTRDELEDLGRKIEQTGRKGRDIESGFKDGADGAGEAVGEFKDEAIQNLSETVSSFRGDAEDIAQIAQDTLGGVIGNLGPVGLAAGTAGAMGIGLIIGAIENAKKAEEEFRSRVAELADVLIDTGLDGADGLDALAGRLRGMVVPEEGVKSLKDITNEAQRAGIPVADLAEAYAGAGGNLQKYIDLMDEEYDAHTGLEVVATRENAAKLDAYKKTRSALQDLADEQEAAAEAEKAWHESGAAAIAAKAERMGTLQGALDDAMGSWKDYEATEETAIDPAGYIAAMQERMTATTNFNANVNTLAEQFGLTSDEVQAILDQGIDFAPMLQSIVENGMGEQYATQVRAMLDGGQAIVDGQPTTATVEVQSNTDAADAALDKTAQDRDTDVTAKPDTKAADKALSDLVSKKRVAKVTAELDKSAAETALANFINRQRTVTVTAEVRTREGKLVP